MSQRELGYYWVKFKNRKGAEWEIALWQDMSHGFRMVGNDKRINESELEVDEARIKKPKRLG